MTRMENHCLQILSQKILHMYLLFEVSPVFLIHKDQVQKVPHRELLVHISHCGCKVISSQKETNGNWFTYQKICQGHYWNIIFITTAKICTSLNAFNKKNDKVIQHFANGLGWTPNHKALLSMMYSLLLDIVEKYWIYWAATLTLNWCAIHNLIFGHSLCLSSCTRT